MRPITMMQAQFKMDTNSGTSLTFEQCKGGYFSTLDEYGLKVIGKTAQNALSGKNLFNPLWSDCRLVNGIAYTTKDTVGLVTSDFIDMTHYNYIAINYAGSCGWYSDKSESTIVQYDNKGVQNIFRCYQKPDGANYVRVTSLMGLDIMAQSYNEAVTSVDAYEPYCGGIPSPNPDYPQEIQCVKAGTRVLCGESGVVVPCDLYEGDSWYPMTGKVIKTKATKQLTANDGWAYYNVPYNRAAIRLTDMMPGTIGGSWGYCNIAKNGLDFHITDLQCFFGIDNNDWFYLSLDPARGTTLEEFKQVIQSVYDNGGEVRIVYTLETPVIEQYDPQFISAPQSTVSVTQVPTELTAELSATMLVRR